ncbi:bacteriorhodopsin [Haloarculaceae archaeon H-GB2-1]|nr:bacteriorhodopsin [Haloarculaceae archaeon H-GB1-1]MEA5387476.1 bacteriorhodopsin [Haloarculaceae archaeon H-GB11]MEA5408955.1 bacteriorhodopsin [Haloarculaceae archaeon H-GB2-1]
MVDITTWFGLGTVGMLLGTVGLGYATTLVPERERRRFALLAVVPAIALVAYGLMALGFGGLETGHGTVYVPRYVDWLLTTPIHIAFIGLLVGADRSLIVRTAGLQAATIVLGFAGAVLASPLDLVAFALGSATFGVVVWYLFRDFEAVAVETQPDGVVDLFRKIRSFVVVLWLIYPVIWLLAPAGFGFMDIETTSLVVTYIDVVAKGGFGLIVLNDLRIMDAVAELDAASAD